MSRHWIVLLLVLTLLDPSRLFAEQTNKSSLEYFTVNRAGRLLITVQVWGDVTLNGTHHVPDDTTLLQLLGYAGGLKGELADAKVTIRRETDPKLGHTVEMIEIAGTDLVGVSAKGNLPMQSGDIVYVQTAPPGENTMRTLTLVATIVGIISSSLLTYYLIQQKN